MATDGNLVNKPADVVVVQRYYQLYGEPTVAVPGKMTRAKPDTRVVSAGSIQRTVQSLSSDIMFVMEQPFLISISETLNLAVASNLESEGKISVERGLQGQITLLGSRGFKVSMDKVDPQGSVDAVETSFPEILFDIQGAGDHLTKVDIKIRPRIKETARVILSLLPYTLPAILVKDLVTYCVNRINVR